MSERQPSIPPMEKEPATTVCDLLHLIFKSGVADKDDERALREHAPTCDRCSGLLFEFFGIKETFEGETE